MCPGCRKKKFLTHSQREALRVDIDMEWSPDCTSLVFPFSLSRPSGHAHPGNVASDGVRNHEMMDRASETAMKNALFGHLLQKP